MNGTLPAAVMIQKGMPHRLAFLSDPNSLEKLRPRIFSRSSLDRSGFLQFLKISLRWKERKVCPKENLSHSHDLTDNGINLLRIEERGSSRIVIDIGHRLRHLRHQLVEGKTTSPVGQYDGKIWKREDEFIEPFERGHPLTRIGMSQSFIGMEEEGNSLLLHLGEDRFHGVDILGSHFMIDRKRSPLPPLPHLSSPDPIPSLTNRGPRRAEK